MSFDAEPGAGRGADGVTVSSTFETRQGEAILAPASQSRPIPSDGLSALIAGGSAADMFLHGFVLAEIAEVSRVESATSPEAALDRLLCNERPADLVLIDHDPARFDAFAFEAALAECLRPAVRPLLVLLATEFRPCELIRSAVDGRFAARMVKPILDAQCRHLISRLFTGSRLA